MVHSLCYNLYYGLRISNKMRYQIEIHNYSPKIWGPNPGVGMNRVGTGTFTQGPE